MKVSVRSPAIDIVRVVGVIAVAIGHHWGGPPDDPNLIRIAIYSWQVPIFFFLTGYLWTTGRPLKREVSSRAKSLLLPYAAWTIILGVPLAIAVTAITGAFPAEQAALTVWGGGLVRGAFAPYWFLPVLFFVAVLLRASERAPRWLAWAAAVAGLAACYVWGADLSRLPLDVFFTLPCMLFALAGQEVAKARARISAGVGAVAGAGLLVVSGALLLLGIASPLDIKLGNFGTPLVSVLVSAMICSGMVLIAHALFDRVAGWPARFVTELATVSVVVLLTHTFFFALYGGAGLPGVPVFVLSMGSSWGLGWLIHHTLGSVVLAGVPRASRRASAVADETHRVYANGADRRAGGVGDKLSADRLQR